MAEPALEVIDVSAHYGPSVAGRGGRVEAVLASVSLTVLSGETLAILGPNGAGKSTLLRVLAGTLVPDKGEVRLFGAPLAGMRRRDVAREVAFVTQSEEVRFAFSVREIVMMGRAPHQGTSMRASAADQERVDALLEECDLVGLADRPVSELSGGEQKRVAIARAFAQSTRVLLLDEPTSSLDVPHQVKLFEQLRRAAEAAEKACVVVTHDLQLAAAHATRVALMKRGQLLAVGPAQEVLSEARLHEVFDWPIDTGTLAGTNARVFVPRRLGLN